MIDWLRGKIIEIEPTHLILDVQGVGYGIEIPVSTYEKISEKEDISLFIETIIKENEIKLYGFESKKDKEFFKNIITVSGIGPRTAIAMLSTYSVDELITIISDQNIKALTRVPGIGKKTAERILFELREKFEQKEQFQEVSRSISREFKVQNSDVVEETILALAALGYKQSDAEKAVYSIFSKMDAQEISVELLLKACLKEMK